MPAECAGLPGGVAEALKENRNKSAKKFFRRYNYLIVEKWYMRNCWKCA